MHAPRNEFDALVRRLGMLIANSQQHTRESIGTCQYFKLLGQIEGLHEELVRIQNAMEVIPSFATTPCRALDGDDSKAACLSEAGRKKRPAGGRQAMMKKRPPGGREVHKETKMAARSSDNGSKRVAFWSRTVKGMYYHKVRRCWGVKCTRASDGKRSYKYFFVREYQESGMNIEAASVLAFGAGIT